MAMSLPRRLALLAWAERHQAAILEDDYDSEFRYGGRPIEPLQTLDTRAGSSTSARSPRPCWPPCASASWSRHPHWSRPSAAPNTWPTGTPPAPPDRPGDFIDQGLFARHLRRMRAGYQQRHQQIAEALADRSADHLRPILSAAGLHVAATAPTMTEAELQTVLERVCAHGVAVQPLSMYDVGPPGQPGIVLGYGAIPTADIDEGLARLRRSFDS